MNLTPVIAFSHKDHAAAARILDWSADLCGQQPVDCIIGYEPEVPASEVQRAASRAFRNIEHLTLRASSDSWPSAAGDYFAIVAAHMRGKSPWLWLEPDCVPTRKDWLQKLALQYEQFGKPCLGVRIPSYFLKDGVWTQVGEMLAGVAIYHQNLWDHSPLLQFLRQTNAQYARAKKMPRAFDSYLANEILPNAASTTLIQHMGRSTNFRREGGQIVCTYGAESRWSNVVSPEAVLIHGCKDASLIDLLRAEMVVPHLESRPLAPPQPNTPPLAPKLPLQTHEFIAAPGATAWGDEAKIPPELKAASPYSGDVSTPLPMNPLYSGKAIFPQADERSTLAMPFSQSAHALADARKAISHWPECKARSFALKQKIGRYRVACQCGAMSPKLPEGVDWEAAWEAQPIGNLSEKGGDEPCSPSANNAVATTLLEAAAHPVASNAAVESNPPTAAKPRKKYKPRSKKPSRTPEQQKVINDRMAAMRAKRVINRAHQQEAARSHW